MPHDCAPPCPGLRALLMTSVLGLGLVAFGVQAQDSAPHSTPHPPAHSGVPTVLTVGIVPQQSATRLARIWTPVLDAIAEASGHQLRFSTAKDIPTFEACLAQGAYDIAYMNPYHYTVFHDQAGYTAFARQQDKQLRGLIVVRNDADIESLADLEGADIAFPSPAAFGASVIPRAELRATDVSFTPHYVKSHDSVYRAVSAGLMPAGGGVMRTFNTVDDTVRADLKIIYRTDGYTPHAFAAHPDLPDAMVTDIRSAMQGLSADMLASLGMAGLEAAEDGDWDDVRGLNLRQEQTEIVEQGGATCHSG